MLVAPNFDVEEDIKEKGYKDSSGSHQIPYLAGKVMKYPVP